MKVLIAEDEPVSRRLLEILLGKWGYEVDVANDGAAALALLQGKNPPRFAVLDWMMPGLNGVEVCRQVRLRTAEPYVYIILLTARGRREAIVQGLDAGADDFVIKPFDAQEFRARMRAGCRVLELQEQLLAANEALRAGAALDPLTGLWNRGAILEILHRELARSDRDGSSLAVIMADIDYLEKINDSHGHLAGDAVLREVTRRMALAIRPYDVMGRYGGGEFLLVTPGCDTTNALKVAERLRRDVSSQAVDIFEGSFPITVSLGVVASTESKDADFLIRAAGSALFRAKGAGRNRVEPAATLAHRAMRPA